MKEYFKNDKHTFEATINKSEFGDTIKIGGKSYNDCINISIIKDSPTKAKIPYLQSEPECSFEDILDSKDTVNFIKASLQYVCMKYPDVKIFEFDDMSHIECGKKKGDNPPRKFEKPFSLAHLYLATHGETWYEHIFRAMIKNKMQYDNYLEVKKKLSEKIDIEYDKFKWLNKINNIQDKILSKYYSKDKSWIEFFSSIPKNHRCDALYKWLEYFINQLLENKFTHYGWYIDIDNMPKISMEIIEKPIMKGGKRTRKNNRIKITNKHCWDGNGYIFDGND
jgi:hypothetical protein